MTVKECYEQMGGNYDDVMSRLRTDERVIKFLGKVVSDTSFELLTESLKNHSMDEAFRAAHTLKGVSMNLSLTKLYGVADKLTEALRGRSDYGEDLVPLYDAFKEVYLHTIESSKTIQN